MRFGFKSPALVSRCVRQPWPDRDAAAAGASAQEARGGAGKPRSRQRRSDRSARRKGADRAAGGEEEEGGRAYWTDAERPRDTPFADETKDTKGPAGHASPPRRSRHGSCIAGALRTLQVRVIKTRALEQSAGATSQLLRAPRLHAHYATRDGDATGWEAARQQPLVAGPPLLLLEPHRARPQGTATGHDDGRSPPPCSRGFACTTTWATWRLDFSPRLTKSTGNFQPLLPPHPRPIPNAKAPSTGEGLLWLALRAWDTDGTDDDEFDDADDAVIATAESPIGINIIVVIVTTPLMMITMMMDMKHACRPGPDRDTTFWCGVKGEARALRSDVTGRVCPAPQPSLVGNPERRLPALPTESTNGPDETIPRDPPTLRAVAFIQQSINEGHARLCLPQS
ncbi:unnamed protein product [Lampetra planeri]